MTLGAIFPNYGYSSNTSMESDQEIIFKHAIYVSNQNKLTGYNSATSHPTLLHKIIHVNKQDQLKTIKNSKFKMLINTYSFVHFRPQFFIWIKLGVIYLDLPKV